MQCLWRRSGLDIDDDDDDDDSNEMHRKICDEGKHRSELLQAGVCLKEINMACVCVVCVRRRTSVE